MILNYVFHFAGNVGINSSHAMQVTTLTPDTSPVYLVSFTLNMDKGEMSLTFSEPVNWQSFTLDGEYCVVSLLANDAISFVSVLFMLVTARNNLW